MRRLASRAGCLAGALATCWSAAAAASGPLEYPDNGSASFSRGGAWLAVGTDPIATHYNPAALATGRGGISLEQNLAFNKVCFDRRNPGNEFTGPAQGQDEEEPTVIYRPVCNKFADAPRYVPSLSVSFRLAPRVGVGFAIVPPAAYGSRRGEFPDMVDGYNTRTGETVRIPAPWRYQVLENNSTILLPTLSAGFEVFDGFRLGAGFIWGFALIESESAGVSTVNPADVGDHADDDSRTKFNASDKFVPGVVASVHYSVARNVDVAGWFRWIDAVRTRDTEVTILGNYYRDDLSDVNEICKAKEYDEQACEGQAVRNEFGRDLEEDESRKKQYFFRFKIPMEARIGFRYHQPRGAAPPEGVPTRDPLRDDIWDIELDLSWSNNSDADTIEVRFPQNERDGTGVLIVNPVGRLPPNSDRRLGYKDSFGARLGGQYNVIAEKLGLLAGTWIETAAVEAENLNLSPVAAMRGGVGGGVVLRQDRFDFHIGYQRHWNAGLDNRGNGNIRSGAGTVSRGDPPGEFRIGGPEGENEFRTYHAVNGGKVVQSANVFTLGGIYRF